MTDVDWDKVATGEIDWTMVTYHFHDGAEYKVIEILDPKRHIFCGMLLVPHEDVDPGEFARKALQPFLYYAKLNSFLFNMLENLHGRLFGVTTYFPHPALQHAFEESTGRETVITCFDEADIKRGPSHA